MTIGLSKIFFFFNFFKQLVLDYALFYFRLKAWEEQQVIIINSLESSALLLSCI